MALTTVEYTYSGQASFVIPFSLGILNRAYVTIQINNQVDGSGDPLYYTNFTWTSDSEVVINGLTNGDIIKIARAIPSNVLLSDYTAGSNITRDNLNIANKQLIMLIHEVLDKNGTQQTKLDTIEPNAKDDQTPAEIKTAYESIADTNAFTDADESKLDGIEPGADVTDTANVTAAGAVMDSEVTDLPGIKAVTVSTLQVKPSEGAFVDGDKTKLNTIESNATADQTDAEIRSAVEAAINSNVFTDSALSKLNSIENNADVTDTANVVAALTAGTNITIASDGTIASTATGGGGGVSDIVEDLTPELGGDLDLNGQDITGTGNIAITGTVNTRDMAADGTKLDAIEAGATADQTKADIDALNIDADTLDGQHGAHYLDYNNLVNTPTIPGSGPSGYATESYVDTAVADIVDSAPGTLDTLNELAQALGDDPNFATTTATNLSQKLPKAGGTMTGDILFNDNVKAKYGTSSDLQIYHNGSNSYIDEVGTGHLFVRANSLRLSNADNSKYYIICDNGGTTKLNYDGTTKLQTTSNGALVTHATNISMDGTASGQFKVQGSGYGFAIALDADAANLYTNSSSRDLVFGVNETEVARVTPAGLDVTGGIDVANGTTYTTTGDFLAKVQQNSNASGKNGLSVMNAWASDTSTIFEAAMGWNGSSSGYYPVFKIDGLGKTTWTDNAGNVRATIDGNGLDVNGSIDTIGTSNTRQWSVGTAGAKMGVYALDNSTMYMRVESGTSSNFQFGTYDNIPIYTITNNSVKTTLLGNGNFGIGHTSPVAKMAILGSSNSTITEANSNLCVEGSGGNGMLFGTLSTTGFKSYIQSGFVSNLGTATYDLLLNPEGGNVGIGTTAPAYKIDARGAANTDVAIQVKASGTGDVDAELRLDAADTGEALVRFARDGTTRAIAEYTNADEWNFTTYNNDKIDFQPNSTNAFRITDSNVYSYKTFNAQDDIKLPDNSQIKIGTGDDLLMYQDATASIIKHNTSGQLFFMGDDIRFVNKANNNAIMYLINDVIQFHGNSKRVDNTHSYFGTGNDLDIYHDGNSWIRDIGTGNLYIDSGSGVYLYANGNATMLQALPGAGVTSYYNGVGKFATTSSGAEVLGNLDVTNALNVGGASAAGSGFIESTVVGSSRALQTVGSVNTTQTHIGFENLYGEIGRIDVSAFSVSYVTSSDYRLKTDVQPMQDSIDRVKALKPVNFEWKEEGTRVDGFIAHEVQDVVPEAISGEKDGMRDKVNIITPLVQATYDEEGNELTPEIPAVTETEQVPDYQGIDQSKLVPLLTSALQEALAKIDDLELRMANLEN